jgi:hypothetical protein
VLHALPIPVFLNWLPEWYLARKTYILHTLLSIYTAHIYRVHSSSTGFYNPLAGFSLLILEVSRSHTLTHHSR